MIKSSLKFSSQAIKAAAHYARVAPLYNKDRAAAGYASPAIVYELLKDEIKPAPEIRFLDLAAGTGLVSAEFNRNVTNVRATLVDVCPEMLTYAQRAMPQAEYVLASLENELPLPSKQFDFAALIGSYDHLKRIRFLFPEIARVLKPSGWIVVDTFPHKIGVPASDEECEIFAYTPDQLKGALIKAGFTVQKTMKRNTYARSAEDRVPNVFIAAQNRP